MESASYDSNFVGIVRIVIVRKFFMCKATILFGGKAVSTSQ